jgi:hypothetical protein
MPAPIKVSFAVAGEKELLKAFDTIEKRVQALAKAEEKAARASESSAKSRVKAARSEAASSGGGYRTPGINGQSYREQEREAKAHAQRMDSIGRQLTNASKRESASRVAAIRKAVNDEIRENRRAEIARAKSRMALLGGAAGAVGRGVRGTVGSVAGVAGGLGVTAGGYAISNALVGAAQLRHKAAGIVQSTRDAKTGKRTQSSEELVSFANQMSTTYGVDSSSVLEGMGTVAARAGGAEGLTKARKDWEDLTKTAVAYGVSMEDMGGVVAAALNAGVEPGKDMRELIQDLVASGKIGAVEFADMAGVLAQLAGAGLQTELKGSDMIRRMTGLAQIAVMQKVSPEAARTSTEDLLRDLTMGQKSMDLEKAGVKVFNDKGQTRDPSVIMAEMMDKMAKGELTGPGGAKLKSGQALSHYFTGSSKAIGSALLNEYNKAGGGEGGKKAVVGMISRASGGKLAAGERDSALADMLGTEVTQANIAMSKFKVEIGKMLPEFAKLLPELLKVTQGFAKMAVWVSKNPLEGLGALLAYKIGAELSAAAIPNLLKSAIESGFQGGVFNVANLKAAGAIGIVATTVTLLGMKVIDNATEEGKKAGTDAFGASMDVENITRKAASGKTLSPEEVARLQEHRKTLSKFSEETEFGAVGAAAKFGWKDLLGLNPAAVVGEMAGVTPKREGVTDRFFKTSALESQGLSNEEANRQLANIDSVLKTVAGDLKSAASNLKDASRSGKPPARPGGP